jgi:hypothetical protein
MIVASVIDRALREYADHLQLILLFSFSVVIALLIPLFAYLPAYNSIGAIFLRNTSIFSNITPFNFELITISTLFSLLFFSFAIVAINVIVKHSRTHTKITQEVMRGLERYTGRVFVVLLIFTIICFLLTFASYVYGFSIAISYVGVLIITSAFFYAPSSIVIDENSIIHSFRSSFNFFVKRIDYFILWVVCAIVLFTLFDFIFIAIGGPQYAGYLSLLFDSFFILPFLVILQSESYMKRFALLKD